MMKIVSPGVSDIAGMVRSTNRNRNAPQDLNSLFKNMFPLPVRFSFLNLKVYIRFTPKTCKVHACIMTFTPNVLYHPFTELC